MLANQQTSSQPSPFGNFVNVADNTVYVAQKGDFAIYAGVGDTIVGGAGVSQIIGSGNDIIIGDQVGITDTYISGGPNSLIIAGRHGSDEVAAFDGDNIYFGPFGGKLDLVGTPGTVTTILVHNMWSVGVNMNEIAYYGGSVQFFAADNQGGVFIQYYISEPQAVPPQPPVAQGPVEQLFAVDSTDQDHQVDQPAQVDAGITLTGIPNSNDDRPVHFQHAESW